MRLLNSVEIVKQAAGDFVADEGLERAAALAYCTALGLAPTVMLFLSVATILGEDAQLAMMSQMQNLIGGTSAEAIKLIIDNAEDKPAANSLSGAIGLATLLFSASGIFAQLQATLNKIWDVEVKQDAGWWNWVRARILSVGMVFAVLFLLLVSLVVSASVAIVASRTGVLGPVITAIASISAYALLFALIFKFLPDVTIAWRDVWLGALLTAVLFAVGKFGIGLYLGNSAVASSYGAAGSLVALLVWVYYSAAIVFFGAELTQVLASRIGSGIKPAPYATVETLGEARRGQSSPA